MRLTLAEVKQRVSKLVPQNIDYEVDVEAGSIAIITKQPEAFGGAGQSLTVKIAKNVKRRVIVRPHSDILADEKTVRQKVNEIMKKSYAMKKQRRNVEHYALLESVIVNWNYKS